MIRTLGPGMMMAGMAGNTETFPVIELRATQLETTDLSVPERLTRVPSWAPAQAARTRTFTLDMPMMGMGGMMGRRTMDGLMGINGRSMSMSRIDVQVPLGSIEIWEIRNATVLAHSFHIHDIQFRVLDRDGNPPLRNELGCALRSRAPTCFLIAGSPKGRRNRSTSRPSRRGPRAPSLRRAIGFVRIAQTMRAEDPSLNGVKSRAA